MNEMKDNDISFGKTTTDIILEHTLDYKFPICFNFPVGHLNDNRCIILGMKSVLNITENGVSLQQPRIISRCH